MIEYKYVCVHCGQEFTIDGATREAILANGCPSCAAPAQADYFAPQDS